MKYAKLILALYLMALGAGCGNSSSSNGTTATSTTETQASGTETQSSATAPQPSASNNSSASQSNTTGPRPATSNNTTTQPAGMASQPSTTGGMAVSQQLAQVKQDVNQTAQDLKVYTYEQKDEFVQAMQAEIDKLNQDLLQLTAKIDVAGDSVKVAAQPKLEALKTQVAALDIYLNEAKNATAATWDEVKADAQKAYAEAKQDFQDAGQWVDQQVNH